MAGQRQFDGRWHSLRTHDMAGATHNRRRGSGVVGVVGTEGGAMACYRPMPGFGWAVG